jgi:hypothetical protein
VNLANPDVRRGLRAAVDAAALLALVALLYWLTDKLSGNAHGLAGIAHGSLIIIGLGTLFYGAENVTRAIKLTGPAGFAAEFGADAPAAAQTVADAAKTKADQISEAAVVQTTEAGR